MNFVFFFKCSARTVVLHLPGFFIRIRFGRSYIPGIHLQLSRLFFQSLITLFFQFCHHRGEIYWCMIMIFSCSSQVATRQCFVGIVITTLLIFVIIRPRKIRAAFFSSRLSATATMPVNNDVGYLESLWYQTAKVSSCSHQDVISDPCRGVMWGFMNFDHCQICLGYVQSVKCKGYCYVLWM